MIQLLQEHSSTLYLASLVLLSAGLLAIFFTAFRVWLILRKLRVEHSNLLLTTLNRETGLNFLPLSTASRLIFICVGLTALSAGASVWNIFDRFHRSDFVELEKVHVDERYDKTHFKMSVQTKPNSGKWIQFSATTCDPPEDDVVKNAVLCTFYYVVDPHLHCYDWNAQHAGYTVWRNQLNEPILTSVAGSSAAQCSQTTGTANSTAASRR